MVARRKCSRLQKFRFQLPQAATKRRIDNHITAADYHATDQGVIDRYLKVDLPPQTLCHRLCQRIALRVVVFGCPSFEVQLARPTDLAIQTISDMTIAVPAL